MLRFPPRLQHISIFSRIDPNNSCKVLSTTHRIVFYRPTRLHEWAVRAPSSMSSYSPYAEAESSPPDWKPGEEQTATVFLALSLYLILDVNIGIWRVFKQKQGLYYWALVIGTWSLAIGAIGNILKNFKPNWGPKIWPLWTLLICGGWSLFATAECVVLYSRLHLVNRSHKLQRRILIMIIVGSFALVLPNWVFIFPAYNLDPNVSSVWSPRMAILDRTNQLGFTIMEATISGVYIWSLTKLLRVKSTIRQRRVMRDLFYVNIGIIGMDILVAILIFVNQVNLSYSIQDFTYALKFKLEFVVLNQLMAVATRGLKKETFAERRYYRQSDSTTPGGTSSNETSGIPLQQFAEGTQNSQSHNRSQGIPVTSPAHAKQSKTPRDAYERRNTDEQPLKFDQLPEEESFDAGVDGDLDSEKGKLDKEGAASYDVHLKPDKKSNRRSLRHPLGQRHDNCQQPSGNGTLPIIATATRHGPKKGTTGDYDDDDEEEEIGLHMYVHLRVITFQSLSPRAKLLAMHVLGALAL